jgi:hypothetical protein
VSLDQVGSFLAIGGGLSGIVGLIGQTKKVLGKLAQKRENREKIGEALHALDKLEKCLFRGPELGLDVSDLIEKASEEPTVNDAEQLYSRIPDILESISNIYSAFFELCREANVISGLQFIQEIRKTDPESYDVVTFFGKCYHEGKVDIRDLPILISLYRPRGRQAKQVNLSPS